MSPNSETTIKTLPTKIEELVLEIGEALSGAKIFSTSVHDATGETIWTSESVVGPDDHALVLDALDSFALEQLRKSFEQKQDEGRIKVVFAAREPRGALRGALLIEASERSLGGREGERGSMQRGFARLLQRLALRLAGKAPTAEPPSVDMPHLPVLLFVQQLLKLRSSGRTRRYEVLLRSDAPGKVAQKAPADLIAAAEQPGSGGKLDRYVVDELCRWLAENHAQLEVDPASFTVNLSTGALLDEHFIGFLEKTMEAAHLSPRVLGFEVREQQCLKHPKEAERFFAACDQLACQVVIDDFTFHTGRAAAAAPARRAHAEDRRRAHDRSVEGQGRPGAGGGDFAGQPRAGHALRRQAHRFAHGAPVAFSRGRRLRAGIPARRAASDHAAGVAAPDRAGAPRLGRTLATAGATRCSAPDTGISSCHWPRPSRSMRWCARLPSRTAALLLRICQVLQRNRDSRTCTSTASSL